MNLCSTAIRRVCAWVNNIVCIIKYSEEENATNLLLKNYGARDQFFLPLLKHSYTFSHHLLQLHIMWHTRNFIVYKNWQSTRNFSRVTNPCSLFHKYTVKSCAATTFISLYMLEDIPTLFPHLPFHHKICCCMNFIHSLLTWMYWRENKWKIFQQTKFSHNCVRVLFQHQKILFVRLMIRWNCCSEFLPVWYTTFCLFSFKHNFTSWIFWWLLWGHWRQIRLFVQFAL